MSQSICTSLGSCSDNVSSVGSERERESGTGADDISVGRRGDTQLMHTVQLMSIHPSSPCSITSALSYGFSEAGKMPFSICSSQRAVYRTYQPSPKT